MLLPSHFLALLERNEGPIWVGEVPYLIAERLGLKNHNVYLARGSLVHILDDHPDINIDTLMFLPLAINDGLWVQERAKPHVVISSYISPEIVNRHMVLMKIAAHNTEIWISSFYRARTHQIASLLKRGIILRDHK